MFFFFFSLSGIPLANIDLIEQDISSENFQLIERQINQSPISANDDGTRISTVINEKYIQMPENVLQMDDQNQLTTKDTDRILVLEKPYHDELLEAISTPITITKTSEEATLNQQKDSIESQSKENEFFHATTTTDFEATKTEEDENVELSSDSLVDIFRQIRTLATTTHLPTVDQTEQLVDKSIRDTQQSNDSNQLEQHLLSNTPHILIVEQRQYPISSSVNNHFPVPWKTTFEESIDTVQIPSTTLANSGTEFSHFIEDRYFPSTIDEPTLLNNDESTAPDFTQLYYRLHEQRHLQPVVLDQTLSESKEETSTNPQGHFDIDLFSMITNLPSKEYRQVFGVSDDVIDTMDDLTSSVEQTVSVSHANDHITIRQSSHDDSTKKEIVNNEETTTEAELDLRYSVLLDRMNTLLRPLMDLSSTSRVSETRPITSVVEIERALPTSSEDYAKKESIDQSELSTSTKLEGHTVNDEEQHQEITNANNVTDHIKSLVTTVVSTFTNALSKPESTEEVNPTIESIQVEPELQVPLTTNQETKTSDGESSKFVPVSV